MNPTAKLDTTLVRELMQRIHLSQRDLAAMSGVTEAAMSRYLAGVRQPRAEKVANMATALHTTSDHLLGRKVEGPDIGETIRLVARNADKIPDDVKLELVRILMTPPSKTRKEK